MASSRGSRTRAPATAPACSSCSSRRRRQSRFELIQRLRTALPKIGITFWAPLEARASLAGARIAFGRPLQPRLALHDADVIVALDADLVGDHPMALAHARQLADRRRVGGAGSTMSRIYAIEPAYTTTGVLADHRFRIRGREIIDVARELLAEIAAAGRRVADADVSAPRATGERARWVGAIARDLVRAAGRGAVVAGERQPASVHAIAAAINLALGNVGHTVSYGEPVVFEAGESSHELAALSDALARRAVTALVIVGGNPAYTAPVHTALAAAIAAVPALYVGLYANETARACRYVVPALHDLERWDVARAHDGTLTPIQPLIEPLFDGRSTADVLAALLGDAPVTARERVRTTWERHAPGIAFDAGLALGCAPSTAAPEVAVTASAALRTLVTTSEPDRPELDPVRPVVAIELDLRPHPMVYDGRYTNNPWLLELPEPITKLTWDNAAQLSRATAAQLGVDTGDLVSLATQLGTLEAPVIVVPGHADDSITLHFGFGRDGAERIARGIGCNAFALWTGPFQLAATVAPRAGHRALAITQGHWEMEHRPIALSGTLAELGGERFVSELASHRGDPPSLLAKFPMPGAQWAMSIDLTSCTGCSACVMACAAENNTPVVGRTQVLNSREMHWLRIDRYVDDDARDGDAVIAVQPMLCQHCEAAPCEYVCPVEATTHSPDGLNEMTYNRCVGTRFCSNNCPYKVRRFNWFDFKNTTACSCSRATPTSPCATAA